MRAVAAVEQRRDALVDALLHQPRHGEVAHDADGDEDRRDDEVAVVRAHEVAEQGPAATAQQPGQPAGGLLVVVEVDAAPLVDELVAGEVERRVGVDVVDLVGFDRGHRALTSSAIVSASSLRTAR